MVRREPESASDWFENYADSLFNYAIVRVGDRETAKDLIQDTFLSAFQNRESFRGESSEKTWLFSILKNKIIDHYRKIAADKSVSYSQVNDPFELDTCFDAEGEWKESAGPVDWGKRANDDYTSKEFQEILLRCLQRLTAQCRVVFSLKYFDELEFEEICKQMAISTSNYWVIMHRAKLMLRRCIEKNWIEA